VRTSTSSQNHANAVDGESIRAGAVSFVNATTVPVRASTIPTGTPLTVQFQPGGLYRPKDTGFLFDRFVDMMKGGDR
jgi:carbamoyl-phosphate synthase small subunit